MSADAIAASPIGFDADMDDDDRPTLPTPPPRFETPVEAFFAKPLPLPQPTLTTAEEAFAVQEIRRSRLGAVVIGTMALALVVLGAAFAVSL